MALSPSGGGYVAASGLDSPAPTLPIFNVERVQLQFNLSADFVAACVANNVLILALATGRILRIDLDSPADIDDIDLPKRPSEVGLIRKLFLDPSASHLIINTTLGENFYLHSQARQPKALSRLKSVGIECVAWNPLLPTASTREILIGASDGNVYEVFIGPSNEFYRREEKYLKAVYKIPDGPVVGLWTGEVEGQLEYRRILVSSSTRLLHFVGSKGRHGHEGLGSIFSKIFETETPTVLDGPEHTSAAPSSLAFTPEPPDVAVGDDFGPDEVFAWLTSQGVRYGSLADPSDLQSSGMRTFNAMKLLDRSKILASETSAGRRRATREPIRAMALTRWHMLCFIEGRVVAINRLSEEIAYDQVVLDAGQSILGLMADPKKSTYWLFTAHEIFEISVEDEDRDVWKIMLKERRFDAALRYARGASQKDAVATASGDYLIERGQYLEAAGIYGKSSKPFEEVALVLIDNERRDALRKYLLAKLTSYKRTSHMQRTMIASWLVEIFMERFNALDDTIATKAELVENANAAQTQQELDSTRADFRSFLQKYKTDLDSKTTYDIISHHGREEELLVYATTIDDHNYIVSYWVQRGRWSEAVDALKKQTEPPIFYKYSTVLMKYVPTEVVDILMRHPDLEPRKLVPAMLNYAGDNKVPIGQNQAARYLLFCINNLGSTDAAIHNTLISVYAADTSSSESALLSYLSAQSTVPEPYYDLDFALRLCIQHNRIRSCVHIYSLMSQYVAAVQLALKHDEIELATSVADRAADSNPALRKRLWLAIARKVISGPGAGSIKTALDFLKRCELLRIEDLLPFFPDFVIIDDFKEEICAALESYSKHIDGLRAEMDDAAATAASIRRDVRRLDARYALVLPGERCRGCTLPLLSRQFFVFPSCQHGFHSDCLGKKVVESSGTTVKNRIRELQSSIGRGVSGPRREREVRELDGLVGKEWYVRLFVGTTTCGR